MKALTVAFTTSAGEQRLQQMRVWTHQELIATSEPKQLGMTFCFTQIIRPLETRRLWLAPH